MAACLALCTDACLCVPLQVGMGKTACAVAITQLNPPPAGWRQNRAYQTLRANDYLGEWCIDAVC